MTRLLVGYDGSSAAAAAIRVGGLLFPEADAAVLTAWSPFVIDEDVHRRVAARAHRLGDRLSLMEQEGAALAEDLLADGVALARAAGWRAEGSVVAATHDEGYELARGAEERSADVLVIGSRGLSGIKAALGSTTDLVVQASTVPVLVAPHPMLSDVKDAAKRGPVLVGYDGSADARRALSAAAAAFPGRRFVVATVSAPDADAAEHGALEVAGVGDAEVVVLEPAGPREGQVADELVRCAAGCGAAVVVVGSRGRSRLQRVFLGSVALGVLHRSERPVMVVRHDDA